MFATRPAHAALTHLARPVLCQRSESVLLIVNRLSSGFPGESRLLLGQGGPNRTSPQPTGTVSSPAAARWVAAVWGGAGGDASERSWSAALVLAPPLPASNEMSLMVTHPAQQADALIRTISFVDALSNRPQKLTNHGRISTCHPSFRYTSSTSMSGLSVRSFHTVAAVQMTHPSLRIMIGRHASLMLIL
jgi:hypothetical protein